MDILLKLSEIFTEEFKYKRIPYLIHGDKCIIEFFDPKFSEMDKFRERCCNLLWDVERLGNALLFWEEDIRPGRSNIPTSLTIYKNPTMTVDLYLMLGDDKQYFSSSHKVSAKYRWMISTGLKELWIRRMQYICSAFTMKAAADKYAMESGYYGILKGTWGIEIRESTNGVRFNTSSTKHMESTLDYLWKLKEGRRNA